MFNTIYINYNNLINNINLIKKQHPKTKICAMVKANAYGLGAKEVVKILDGYADFFGVACFYEAKQIKYLTNKKILIVGPLERKIDPRFSYTCTCLDDVLYLASLKIPLNIHIKINTGMNRYGFFNIQDFKRALLAINNSLLNLEGLFTHFPTADSRVDVQFRRFKRFVKVCHMFNMRPILHADNSAVSLTKFHKLDMVRIGFNLFNSAQNGFASVAQIISTIAQINDVKSGELVGYNYRFVANKSMRVAVVPIGYADGFDMHYLGFNLIVDGVKCKVLNICMDCFMLDVSTTNLKVNDKIFILNEQNNLTRYAEFSKTHEYEVMIKFSHMRAKRVIKK